jgi:hypothetical protein
MHLPGGVCGLDYVLFLAADKDKMIHERFGMNLTMLKLLSTICRI